MNYVCASLPNERWYFEVENNFTAFRQILVSNENGEIIASNFKHKEYEFFLSDQDVNFEQDDYIRITKEEFEAVWEQNLERYKQKWQKIKDSLHVGEIVDGYIEVFYPQGIIINLPQYEALGIANYEACKLKEPAISLISGLTIKSMVKGFDEVNNWIILDVISII